MRKAHVTRKTKETDISVEVNLEGGEGVIDIPSGFLSHMLDALSKHACLGLKIKAVGDIHVDLHHTVEDIGIVFGQAIKKALGDKRGITRYGLAKIPMDESLVEVCLDISGRPFFQIHGADKFQGQAGDLDLELVPEFFRSLAFNAGLTVHISVFASGNGHHLAEACFKAFARAIKQAVSITGIEIPSTKEIL